MNSVNLSGIAAGDSELRLIESGSELLIFDIIVDGHKRGTSPIVRCVHFVANDEAREIKGGQRVKVEGALRHRRDYHGLFVAVGKLVLVGTGVESPTANSGLSVGK